MLDIKFIRENPGIIREAILKRNFSFDLDELLKVDEVRIRTLQEVEALRSRQNQASSAMTSKETEERETLLAEMRDLKETLQKKEEELKNLEERFEKLMLEVPNIPDPSVPEGRSEKDNVELRRWGDISRPPFEIKDHLTLLKSLDLADLERGAKVSGFRGYFLKNEGALLSMALWQFTLEYMLSKDFVPFISPALVRAESFVGTGKLPQFRDELYKTEDELYLAATAEIPMMGYHSDEILSEEELPKKYVAFSPCYRREAGAYGKDTKGLFRLHEFMKVEQVILCRAEHQESVRWHEELTKYSEEILQALKIPYRVISICSSELPQGAVKMYDIESWLPSESRFRETHSASILHDFQTRRLKIRYISRDGKTRFLHSLNNTAIATPRVLLSLLETHQMPDGSVAVPEVLRKYLGKDVIRPKDGARAFGSFSKAA
jgi:seryl-tRNA synthetase